MAIYHFHATKGRRGSSAVAKFSYVTRAGKYARARDVLVHSASGRMPAWAAADPRRFWKAADTYERKNGRLFRHYEIALPLELSEAQRVAVAGEYAEHLTAELNLPYSLAVHAGYGKNPHCHLVVSERMNDGMPRTPGDLVHQAQGRRSRGRWGEKDAAS